MTRSIIFSLLIISILVLFWQLIKNLVSILNQISKQDNLKISLGISCNLNKHEKIEYCQVIELLLGFLLRHYAIRTSLFMCTKSQRGANPIPRSVVVHAQVRQYTEKSLIRLRNRLVRCYSVQDRTDNSAGRYLWYLLAGRNNGSILFSDLKPPRPYSCRFMQLRISNVFYARTHARTQIQASQPVSLPLSLSLCARGHK